MAKPTANNQQITTNNHQQLLVKSYKLLANSKSFTLIELLVAVALIAVLAVAVILSLNPSELLKQGRDSTRLSDLQNLNKSLSWFEADTGGTGFMGSSSVIYISIPDTTPTCSNLGLPTPPSGYSYHCVTQQNLQKTDGSGWIPVNFNQISFGKTLTKLPIDPINQTSTGNYYTYVPGGSWKLTTRFDSQKYTSKLVAQDGGPDPALYELGTDLNLAPFVGGLVGYWSFDETGTTAYDYSGYENNGTMYSSSTITDLHTSSGCKRGSCANFNGVDDYVSDNVNNGTLNPQNFTVTAYFKPTDFSCPPGTAGKTLITTYGGYWDAYSIVIYSDYIRGSYRAGPAPASGAGINYAINTPTTTFNFAALSLNNKTLSFYFNGNKIQSVDGNDPIYYNKPYSKFDIGIPHGGMGSCYYGGLIDEVRVYNRALSDSEIKAIYDATK